jgi:hypothetical protein
LDITTEDIMGFIKAGMDEGRRETIESLHMYLGEVLKKLPPQSDPAAIVGEFAKRHGVGWKPSAS